MSPKPEIQEKKCIPKNGVFGEILQVGGIGRNRILFFQIGSSLSGKIVTEAVIFLAGDSRNDFFCGFLVRIACIEKKIGTVICWFNFQDFLF